jgi:hypothetical protein
VALLAFVALILTACVEDPGAGSDSGGSTKLSKNNSSEPKKESPDCFEVPGHWRDDIGFGMRKGVNAKVVGKGFAFKSRDYEKVWMIGFEIDGPGIEGPGDVGVWGTNSDPRSGSGEGLLLAVDGMAREFTVWGAAAKPGAPAYLEPASHGVTQVKECVGAS